ncbi:hypothetical protein GGI25_004657 [Coemansia spiralis]|uniref:Uncharacterized protein n=1 Tax=Coemansia spiralis TaxID=417178 RepID=A0A9W8G574_9FUNG|nr:hypothetical protein GGI25_004657 [Coemansia spiralis]
MKGSIDKETEVHVVKCSLQSAEWAKEYSERPQALVNTMHSLTACTFQPARWIFVHELGEGSSFDPSDFLDQNLFSEMFLHLTGRQKRPNVAEETKGCRGLIKKYLFDSSVVTKPASKNKVQTTEPVTTGFLPHIRGQAPSLH